jgi:hypothetical protein
VVARVSRSRGGNSRCGDGRAPSARLRSTSVRAVAAKRARKEIASEPGLEGREKLRAEFEQDGDAYERLKAAYLGGLEAVTTCPNCREKALPDHRARIAAGDSFMAQL